MSDREKVIRGLECHAEVNCAECPYRDGWRTCPFGETLLADALSLLKEQESAEPEPTEHIVFGTNRKCSNCGKYLFPACNFCPHCGRSVKWE